VADVIIPPTVGERAGEFDGAVHRHGRTIVWVDTLADYCVLADADDFRRFELSGTSAQLWRRFDGHRSDAAVIAEVIALYPDHPETAAHDCATLITELDRLGVLESTRPEPDDVPRRRTAEGG
jgi:hypothetical protein